MLHDLAQDVRYGIRALLKAPGFTAVAVLTLALGIGANSAIFSFVDAVLLRPLPYPEPDRVVLVMEKPPRGLRNPISTLNFLDWKSQNTVFESLAANTGVSMTLSGRQRAGPAARRTRVGGLLRCHRHQAGARTDLRSRRGRAR